MKIAMAQMQMTADLHENLEKSLKLIEKAAEQGADLICFPEIQLSPFFPQTPDADASRYLLTPDSPEVQAVCAACRSHYIYGAPNFYLADHGKNYDTSLLIDNTGKIIGHQKMVHIAECPQFYEQSYYTPSDDGFHVYDTPFGKIGIVVCFDRHYPEAIRTEALRGAELILVPTANTKAEPSELFVWEIRVQAFQNSVNIAMCNRVGTEDAMTFSGESIVCDYNGDVAVQADDKEALILVNMDLPAATKTRAAKPYTALRRKTWYA